MRKVYAGLFSSIDGVVEAPNEWQPAFDEEKPAFDEEMGAALTTFELASAQPTSSGTVIASYRPVR
jgi:hypothetical protein